jgi:MFS superfamily sulfate permease-like transporter
MAVPQSISYARPATLPPEYGLYSAFRVVGVFIYCFFATSKHVTIGPVDAMSLQVARVIASVQASHPNQFTKPQRLLLYSAAALYWGSEYYVSVFWSNSFPVQRFLGS